MPTKTRRIMLSVLDPVPLLLLGLKPPEAGATQIWAQLTRYAGLVEQAGKRVAKVLARQEWNAIADVMTGFADLYDYAGSRVPNLMMIRANVEDGHNLDGLGYKWFGDGVPGDEGAKALIRKLSKMTDLEGDAIAAAVRWFWLNHESIDHAEDEWWTIDYRTWGPRHAQAR